MLHSLTFSNFYSFLDEVEISFAMDGRAAENEKSCASRVAGGRTSKILAVIGANGAGKTNAIKPFAFLSWFICKSVNLRPDSGTYVRQHFLRMDEPTSIQLNFEVKDRLFRYTLKLDSKKIHEEELHEKTSRQWSNVFSRVLDFETDEYTYNLKGFGFDKRTASKTKKNSSLISFAAQQDNEFALFLTKYFSHFQSNINASGRAIKNEYQALIDGTEFYETHEHYRELMVSRLKRWDLGLSDVKLSKLKHVDEKGEEFEMTMPFGVHTIGDDIFEMPLLAESSGTQSAYVLLSRLLPVLMEGGVVIYDELESDLHPHMLDSILDLFFNPKTNPHNAQIIFTTHSVEILNDLQKCQILLVEKIDGISEAWRLCDMSGVRSDDNFYAKYMSGTYGAVPNI
ncbi:AAA family ATPase [Pseudomonas sp. BJa3]|uniref:AAA family ATPase n=1 Tax=Pseudomonas sp. BJa3 TaxID=2986525 RepID=UPI002265A6EA|nr:ATP-binding protein [Pseudomonas sp. BJa3]MCX5511241.1 ATP-binding protein [Pseudomonas sp. BJa3]